MSEDDKKQGEEKDKKEQKKRGKGGKIALAAVAIASGLSAAGVVGGAALYNSFFKRYERPDYSVTPGIVCYERVKSDYPREEIFFRSEKVRLKGYYYTVEGAKGLVVVVHGLHAGSDDMLPIITYMLRRGYNVFSYDGTGTYDSEGDGTVGMCRSLVDLDNALSFFAARTSLCGAAALSRRSFVRRICRNERAFYKKRNKGCCGVCGCRRLLYAYRR